MNISTLGIRSWVGFPACSRVQRAPNCGRPTSSRQQLVSSRCHQNHLRREITSVAQLDFSDHKTVFSHKTTLDLVRSLGILRICSINRFVDNALPLMRLCEKWLGPSLFSLLARPTFYRQFVGGDTEQELRDTASRLAEAGLRLMVCPAMEEDLGEGGGETKYEDNLTYITRIGEMMVRAGVTRPCLQFKVTAMVPADLVTSLSSLVGTEYTMKELVVKLGGAMVEGREIRLEQLSPEENLLLNSGLKRLAEFGQNGAKSDLRLLVDAEYTYMNPGISALALSLMLAFNKDRPVVWNTYQCYLKGAADTISAEMDLMSEIGRCFGAKIVRGAYMEKERSLAKEGGYPDPVNDTYEDTGKMYERVVDLMLEHIKKVGDRCNIVCGTHNEAGARHVACRMMELGLDLASDRVVFGQIFGMADQVSVPLAKAGFTVYKSVPYGPLGEVLPYLSRRAAENRVVLAGARREQELLLRELRGRVGGR